MRRLARGLFLLSLACLGGSLAVSQSATSAIAQPPRYSHAVIERWQKELAIVDQMILDGDFKAAKKRVNRLLDEMCDRIVKGSNADRILAMAALIRAVAEMGLGNVRDALWDRDIAYAIYPDLAEIDLAVYGGFVAPLKEVGLELPSGFSNSTISSEDVTPPKRLRAVWPKYPRGRRVNCLENKIAVQVMIDSEGGVHRPTIDQSVSAVLSFAALDVFRHWRFEPAMHKGKPVAVLYNLTVNFALQGC